MYEHIHVPLSIDRWTNVKVECDPSWQPFQGHCYRLQTEKRSWQDSKRACLRGGGDLLSIHSMAELEFITKQIKQGKGLPGNHAGQRGGGICIPNPFQETQRMSFSFVAGARLISVSSSPPPLHCAVPQRWRSCGLASMT